MVQVELPPWATSGGTNEMVPPVPATPVMVSPLKRATTVRAALAMTLQVGEVPVQSPDQPVNVSPGLATAVSVTTVPSANDALADGQPGPQSMVMGDDLTVPWPVLDGSLFTVNR